MNRQQALAYARNILSDNHIEDASLEGEILLRCTLGIDRARLFAELDSNIPDNDFKTLKQLVSRRIKGEPTAYITCKREFYGLEFIVNPHVLIPRPETELLVEKAIALCQSNKYDTIVDVGTGCGAIAVSLAINLPKAKIYAADISLAALKVAGQNCLKHKVENRVTLLQGDLLEPLSQPADMIVANLPYVRNADIPANGPLSFEPSLALNGGEKGLDKIELLCWQVGNKMNKKGALLLEIGEGQATDVISILRDCFPSGTVEVYKDLAGIERVISLRLT